MSKTYEVFWDLKVMDGMTSTVYVSVDEISHLRSGFISLDGVNRLKVLINANKVVSIKEIPST